MPWWRSRWSRRVTLQERADEMRAHLDLYADELMARGWSADDAEREARLKFGNPRAKLEEVAALDRWRHGGSVVRHDIRHALRFFRRHPGFTLTVVSTLAVGIGVTTAVYSIYSAVLLKPLPFDAPERLVAVVIQDTRGGTTGLAGGSLAAVGALPSVARVAGHVGREASLLHQGTPEVLRGTMVTSDFFAVFGVPAVLGRTLLASDTDGAAPVVLSHRLWQQRFGADPAVIGRGVDLGEAVHSVVGVMPASFRYPDDTAFWQPYRISGTELGRVGPGPFTVVARLRSPDATSVASHAAVLSVSEPDGPRTGTTLAAIPLIEFLAASYRASLRLLCGAVGLVLLLSCVNVASLLFASMTSREQEFAIRGAIGATRQRLVRQLLVEATVLTAAGACVGLALSELIIRALPTIGTLDIPRLDEAAIDWRVLLFAVGAAGASVCLVGIVPARFGARRVRSFLSVGRGVVGPRTRMVHNALIVVQVAATLTLAVGSALALTSLYRLQTLNPGFAAHGLTITSIRLLPSALARPGAQAAYSHILTRLQEDSAFDSVAAMSHVPLEPRLATAAAVTSAQGSWCRKDAVGRACGWSRSGPFIRWAFPSWPVGTLPWTTGKGRRSSR